MQDIGREVQQDICPKGFVWNIIINTFIIKSAQDTKINNTDCDQVLKSAKDLILRLRAEDESSQGLAAAMEEVPIKIFIIILSSKNINDHSI